MSSNSGSQLPVGGAPTPRVANTKAVPYEYPVEALHPVPQPTQTTGSASIPAPTPASASAKEAAPAPIRQISSQILRHSNEMPGKLGQARLRRPSKQRLMVFTLITFTALAVAAGILFDGFRSVLMHVAIAVAVIGIPGLVIVFFWKQRSANEAEKLAKRQALEQVFEDQGAEINRLIKVDKVTVVIMVTNQTGGGSKTWTSNHMACEAAETLRLPVAVIEGRRNASVGWKTLGVNPEATVSARELFARKEQIKSANDLYVVTSSNRYGVMDIKTDKDTPAKDTFNGDQAGEVVELVASQNPVVFIDSGNIPTDDINVGMGKKSHIGLFVTIPSDESVGLCATTVNTYRSSGLKHLVDHGFYMVNMLRPDMDPEDFRRSASDSIDADKLDVPPNVPILGTYYDEVTDTTWSAHHSSNRSNKVIDLAKLQLETRIALRRALVTALRLRKAQIAATSKTSSGSTPPESHDPTSDAESSDPDKE